MPTRFEEQLSRERFEHLPLTAAPTRQVVRLPWHHRDPIDRMLIAQARAENNTLLTADEALAPDGEIGLLTR